MSDISEAGIRWMRTVKSRNGKMVDSIALVKSLEAYAAEKLHVDVKAYWDVGGTVGTIRLMADFPNLSAFEQAFGRLMSDPEYRAIIDRSDVAALFIDGTTEDTLLWRA